MTRHRQNPAWVEVEKIIAKRSVPDKASVVAVAAPPSAGAGGAAASRRRKGGSGLAAEEDGLGTRHVLSGFEQYAGQAAGAAFLFTSR